MTMRTIWDSDSDLPDYPGNIASMLNKNASSFADRPIYQEVCKDEYRQLLWADFQHDVSTIQSSLAEHGLQRTDRVAIISQNRKEMLELELAVMAMGAIAVPIFAGYAPEQANSLIRFCEPRFVAVADQHQFEKLSSPEEFESVIHFDLLKQKEANSISFSDMSKSSGASSQIIGEDISGDEICLMMYTSGTMGKPKCVQLTHDNILSQQAAMKILWSLNAKDRFLSYLPWHHSFGGIYEKYSAITNGAVLSLEHGYGKNADILIENWKRVKPTVFFSVPRVYQEIVTRARQDIEIERIIFHDELRFVFTAAAPLPGNIAEMFSDRGIPIYEGYGLTETSPCCTVTDPEISRETGVVGKPISGVSLKLSDEGEILVKGPNVMKGYFKNLEATEQVFSDDGWFRTGDVGEFTNSGLKLISRKDRIFKLSNAEKVVPTEIENLIVKDCPYLSHAFVSGSGKDHPVILLFPNRKMFAKVAGGEELNSGCVCPDGMVDFAKCLGKCLKKMNDSLETKYACVKGAMLVDHELSIENAELTPSMKLAPNVVGKVFKANLEYLYGDSESDEPPDKVFVIDVES